MEDQQRLFELLKEGSIFVETVISRVFIFEKEDTVLKFYKRDNGWWNTSMRDLSHGSSRSNFIRQDFLCNQFLNPKIYLSLKTAVIQDGRVVLIEPKEEDDELVIVMKKADFTGVLTEVLYTQSPALEEYVAIGRSFATTKLALPKTFLPDITTNWYEQMQGRMRDLAEWIRSEKEFPEHLTQKALERLRQEIERQKPVFEKMHREVLWPLIDCNSENLLYNNKQLSFIDAYPPKDTWRIGSFDIDIFRTGADIYAFVGKEAYENYLKGVTEVAAEHVRTDLAELYLLYGAMVMSPYFMMLSRTNPKYKANAEKYLAFVESLLK